MPTGTWRESQGHSAEAWGARAGNTTSREGARTAESTKPAAREVTSQLTNAARAGFLSLGQNPRPPPPHPHHPPTPQLHGPSRTIC